jgi:hypothetical protein
MIVQEPFGFTYKFWFKHSKIFTFGAYSYMLQAPVVSPNHFLNLDVNHGLVHLSLLQVILDAGKQDLRCNALSPSWTILFRLHSLNRCFPRSILQNASRLTITVDVQRKAIHINLDETDTAILSRTVCISVSAFENTSELDSMCY